MIRMQTFFDDGDELAGRDGNPDLRLDCVFTGAKERLDAHLLLDPLEVRFHLPALTVAISDQLGLQCKVVGRKCQALARVVLAHRPALRCVRRGTPVTDFHTMSVDRGGVPWQIFFERKSP